VTTRSVPRTGSTTIDVVHRLPGRDGLILPADATVVREL